MFWGMYLGYVPHVLQSGDFLTSAYLQSRSVRWVLFRCRVSVPGSEAPSSGGAKLLDGSFHRLGGVPCWGPYVRDPMIWAPYELP